MRSADPNLPPSVELEAERRADPPTAAEAQPPPTPEDEVHLAWRVHLARKRPGHLAVALTAITVVMVWATVVFSFDHEGHFRLNILIPLIFGAIMVGALSELLFPISYRLTAKGAYRRNLISASQIEWKNVRKCYLAPDGIKLSPLRRQTRLEAFRGVFLRFGDADREAIIEKVKELRDAGGGIPAQPAQPEPDASHAGEDP